MGRSSSGRIQRGPVLVSIGLLLIFAAHARGEEQARNAKKDAEELRRYDARVKPEDRQHWAFQPVKRPAVPKVARESRVRNPIDAFVLASLEEKGWEPNQSADPRALLRRIYFDLIGLPPTPNEVELFLADPSPTAFDRVVDNLLARPSHGERWARHWLDLARYADTNGYERDANKPSVWRYRDYVIRAFNDDKPFDRFLIEQLAGDELPDADEQSVIATGFHRLGPWDDEPADPKQDRFDQLDDMIATTSEVFLGLTLGCARCHNHKFDPLTMHDYYRMAAIFDPLQRPNSGRNDLDMPAGSPAQRQARVERDLRIAVQNRRIAEIREEFRERHLRSDRSKLPAEALEAFRPGRKQRTVPQQQLALKYAGALEEELTAMISGEPREQLEAAEREIRRLREEVPDLRRGYFLHEPSPRPPTTHLLLRGQATRPGPEVAPGAPTVLTASQPSFPPAGTYTSQRRLTLARWLAAPEHPLTARVFVNRIWQAHFGDGLVRTPSDFGTMGEFPSHPELLDWLADWFVREGYSIKKLHRLILASNTYRMSGKRRPDYAAVDPENRLLWRRSSRRLEVEAIRDAMLAVSGQLNPEMYGPGMYPQVPAEAIEAHSDPAQVWKPFDETSASRRTIYATIKRSMVVPMLEVLDFCDTARTSARRNSTCTAPQALTMLNGDFVNGQARHFAHRLQAEVGDDPAKQVERAYRLALARPPKDDERSAMLAFLDGEREAILKATASRKSTQTATTEALERMCRVLFNLNEFAYTD